MTTTATATTHLTAVRRHNVAQLQRQAPAVETQTCCDGRRHTVTAAGLTDVAELS